MIDNNYKLYQLLQTKFPFELITPLEAEFIAEAVNKITREMNRLIKEALRNSILYHFGIAYSIEEIVEIAENGELHRVINNYESESIFFRDKLILTITKSLNNVTWQDYEIKNNCFIEFNYHL